MAPHNLLLDLPDMVWEQVLQGLEDFPKEVVHLELTCQRLKQRQGPLLRSLLARLLLSHKQQLQMVGHTLGWLQTRMEAERANPLGAYTGLPDMVSAAEGVVGRCMLLIQAQVSHRQTLVQEFGPTFAQHVQLIKAQVCSSVYSNDAQQQLVRLMKQLQDLRDQLGQQQH